MRKGKFILFFCFFGLALHSQKHPALHNPDRQWADLHPEGVNLLPFSPLINALERPNAVHVAPPVKIPLVMDSIRFGDNSLGQSGGVGYYDSSNAQNGVTLLDQTTTSMLIDMNGKVLAKFPFGLTHILSDGTMFGATSGALVKFDADLSMLWNTFAAPHHEITTDENRAVYLLSRDQHRFMGLLVNFDVLKIYSPDGDLIYEWHVFDHLEEIISIISRSAYLSHLHSPYNPRKGAEQYIAQDPEKFFWHFDPVSEDTSFEFTHMNSIQVLPENAVSKKIPAFKKGNLLLSFNPYSCYGILDTGTGKIEWAGYLPERTTLHTPLLTSRGTVIVYQNSTDSTSLWVKKKGDPCLPYLCKRIPPQNPSPEPASRDWVSITEYDPVTNAKVWEYTANPKESLLASGLGNAERLPNGNTLVCVATPDRGGRVFELTPDKEIVWSYISPEIAANNRRPLTFYRAKRVSYDIAKKLIPGFKK